MSHPVNDEILETLYEEYHDHFTTYNTCGILSNDDVDAVAEVMARRKFEAMSM